MQTRWRFTLLAILAGTPWVVAAIPEAQDAEARFVRELFARAKPEDYLGDAACGPCHAEQYLSFEHSGHAPFSLDPSLPPDKRGCESCHGPGKFHTDKLPDVVAFKKISEQAVAAACLRCHEDVMKSAHWAMTSHAKAGVSCVSCHTVHPKPNAKPPGDSRSLANPASAAAWAPPPKGKLMEADETTLCGSCHRRQVAELRMTTHHPMPEGRMACSDCHDVHPSSTSRKRGSPIKQDCVRCHTEYAGPFVFEHDPVTGGTGEGCMECHRPHGSPHPSLLKGFSRGLCGQCHTSRMASHFPGTSCWASNCHKGLHGSNTSARLIRP